MPPTDAPALSELLDQMFEASRLHGAGVHRKLSSGLHVKAALVGERRQLMAWRTQARLPGRTECEVLAGDAGFAAPKFRLWTAKTGEPAFIITDGYRGEWCEHTWGGTAHCDEKKASGYTATCTSCGARWRTAQARRGGKLEHHYNGVKVRASVFERWQARGPVPSPGQADDPIERDLQAVAEFVEELHGLGPAPVTEDLDAVPEGKETREARKAREKAEAKAAEAAQREKAEVQARRERPIRSRLIRILVSQARCRGVRYPWYGAPERVEAYEGWLRGLTLAELRHELYGPFGRSQRLLVAQVMAEVRTLLVAQHWHRRVYRALPERAEAVATLPIKRPRAPRAKKARAA